MAVLLAGVVLPHDTQKRKWHGTTFPSESEACLHTNPLAQPGGVPDSGLLRTYSPTSPEASQSQHIKENCLLHGVTNEEHLDLFSHFADEGTEAGRLKHCEKAACCCRRVPSPVSDAHYWAPVVPRAEDYAPAGELLCIAIVIMMGASNSDRIRGSHLRSAFYRADVLLRALYVYSTQAPLP